MCKYPLQPSHEQVAEMLGKRLRNKKTKLEYGCGSQIEYGYVGEYSGDTVKLRSASIGARVRVVRLDQLLSEFEVTEHQF